MSMVDGLLRLRRREREERRRDLAELETLAARLRGGALRLHGEITETGRTSRPAFVQALLDRQVRLRRSLAEVESRVAAAGEALAAAEREVRRLELARARRASDDLLAAGGRHPVDRRAASCPQILGTREQG
jgi:hypothetical protein